MRDKRKERIDYAPCPWAGSALEEMADRYPDLNVQALIDKLVITGASILAHEAWTAPVMSGTNRAYWRRPKDFQSS